MEKMREEFESWAMSDMGYMCVRVGGGYKDDYMNTAWLSWKASRAVLCVELPENLTGEYYAEGWNTCLEFVEGILEGAGVQCK